MAIGALGAVALLALGGGAVWYFMPRAAAPAPVAVVTPPVPSPTPPVEVTPSPAPPSEPVAKPSEPQPKPTVEALDKTPEPAPTAEPAAPRTILLTAKAFNATLRKYSSQLLNCGRQFRADIPKSGPVKLMVTVKNSGEVRSATVSEPPSISQGLAKCLEDQLMRVRFPRNHNQPELKIVLPMRFNEEAP